MVGSALLLVLLGLGPAQAPVPAAAPAAPAEGAEQDASAEADAGSSAATDDGASAPPEDDDALMPPEPDDLVAPDDEDFLDEDGPPEEELLELPEEELLDEATDPDLAPLVPMTTERSWDEISLAITIVAGAALAFGLAAGILAVIVNPIVATMVVLNVFSTTIAVPACGGTVMIMQSMAYGAGWACGASAVPSLAATGTAVAGGAAQLAVRDPWIPIAAGAAGGVPGVLVGLASAAGVAVGVYIGLGIGDLRLDHLQRGGTEGLYLVANPAITGGVIALVAGIAGVLAVPVAGLGSGLAGYLASSMLPASPAPVDGGLEVAPAASAGPGLDNALTVQATESGVAF